MLTETLMSTQPGAPRRSRTAARTIAALLGLGVLAGCSRGVPAAGPAATLSAPAGDRTAARSPAALLSAAAAGLRAGGSVHVTITSSSVGGSAVNSDDATADGGRQVMTVSFRAAGGQAAATGKATILLINGICYVHGNQVALDRVFGIPLAQAGPVAGQWIAVRPGDKLGESDYDLIASGIALPSLASQLAISGKLTPTAPGTVDGQRVQGVQGTQSVVAASAGGGTSTMYVTATAPQRPAAFTLAGAAGRLRMVFSRWGETLRLTVPAHPVPAGSVTPVTSTE